jgi:hypothetical protein
MRVIGVFRSCEIAPSDLARAAYPERRPFRIGAERIGGAREARERARHHSDDDRRQRDDDAERQDEARHQSLQAREPFLRNARVEHGGAAVLQPDLGHHREGVRQEEIEVAPEPLAEGRARIVVFGTRAQRTQARRDLHVGLPGRADSALHRRGETAFVGVELLRALRHDDWLGCEQNA